MTTEKTVESLKKLLRKHNQSQLLAFWEQLDGPERDHLRAQIEDLDFSRMDRCSLPLPVILIRRPQPNKRPSMPGPKNEAES
jgi:hypothetical protein